MASFRGRPACSCLVEWLPKYERALLDAGVIKYSLDIYQLIGGATASAGTHASGGAFDVGQFSTKALSIARNMGAAMWHRTRAQGFDIDHGHGVLKGCPHAAPLAKQQVRSCDAGGNGLANNGRDDGPRSSVKFPLRSWQQGIAWAKAEAKPKRVRTSLLMINCASGRNDAHVGGKWVDRRAIAKNVMLRSEASFILTTELYTPQRGYISRGISAKYKLAGGIKGRNIYVRRGRWSRVGVRAFWKPLRSVTRKPVVGIRAKHAESGRVLGVTNTQLSFERTTDGQKNRKSETTKLLRWASVRLKGMGEVHAGDYNCPADGSRPDDVGPIFEAHGFHDLGMEVASKTLAKELQRAFGSPSLKAEKVRVIPNAGSDHPAVQITFWF